MIVNNRHELIEMKHRGERKRWHIADNSGIGSNEFTVCGLAHPDSSMSSEDFEKTGNRKMGGRITCQDCIQKIIWCKKIQGYPSIEKAEQLNAHK